MIIKFHDYNAVSFLMNFYDWKLDTNVIHSIKFIIIFLYSLHAKAWKQNPDAANFPSIFPIHSKTLDFNNPQHLDGFTIGILINDVGRKTHALFPFTTGMRYLRAGGPFHLLIRVLPSLSYTSSPTCPPRSCDCGTAGVAFRFMIATLSRARTLSVSNGRWSGLRIGHGNMVRWRLSASAVVGLSRSPSSMVLIEAFECCKEREYKNIAIFIALL